MKGRDLSRKRSCVFVCLFVCLFAFSCVSALWWPNLIKTCSWLESHICLFELHIYRLCLNFLYIFWRDFSVLQGLRIDSLFHPTFYLMCTRGSYACFKEAGALDWGPPSSVELKNEWSYTTIPRWLCGSQRDGSSLPSYARSLSCEKRLLAP